MSAAKEGVRGGSWEVGAISTAEWKGVRLRDVLLALGAEGRGEHVQFEGLDRDMEKSYGASIPLRSALDPSGDVLLALEMNGAPLTRYSHTPSPFFLFLAPHRDHGAPLRLLVPGVAGARSVKWLGLIRVAEEESPSHWQRNDYKLTGPGAEWSHVDWSRYPSIQEMPVTSFVTSPAPNERLPAPLDERLPVSGIAFAGGGRAIVRVDVSADGGRSWLEASLLPPPQPSSSSGKDWAWRQWRAELPLPPAASHADLVCRAWDAAANGQPEHVETIWNLRGLLNNSWHRIRVEFPPPETEE